MPGPVMRTIASSGEATLNDNLVAYWKMDESSDGSGSVARVDSGPNGLDLSDPNNAPSTTGKISLAVSLVSGSNDYLTRADNAFLSTGNVDFTIAAWVYLTTKTANRGIVGKWVSTGNQREYLLRYTSSSDRFGLFVSPDGTATGLGSVEANNFGSVSISTWYLVIAWHDAVNDLLGIQVNATTPDTASYASGVNDSTAAFDVGRQASGVDTMDGRIDELGFWKSAAGGGGVLSSTLRSALYNSGSGVTCCPFP